MADYVKDAGGARAAGSDTGEACIELADSLRDAIRDRGAAAYPHECCGILIGWRTGAVVHVTSLAEANNVAAERGLGDLRDKYEVDPRAILLADQEARNEGLEIVGFYHSHPDHPAVASKTDAAMAWEGYVYVIVSVRGGAAVEVRAWRLDTGGGAMEALPVREDGQR